MLKALIVDDEEDIREGLKEIIDWGKEGFSIAGLAEDGVIALELFHEIKPHLVITDIRMPRMDGLELSRMLKEIDSEVKVLIISGYDEFSYAKKAMKYGIKNYLLKPVETDELRKELASIRKHATETIYAKREVVIKEEELKNYFLSRLVKGETSQKHIKVEAQPCNIDLEKEWFSILVVDLEGNKGEEIELNIDDYQLQVFAVNNVIREISAKFDEAVLFELSKSRFGILMAGNSQYDFVTDPVKHLAEEIRNCVPKYTKHDIWIGIGDTVLSVSDIPLSFRHAELALEMKFYHKYHIFFYSEIFPHSFVWNIQWTAERLMREIKESNRNRIAAEISLCFLEIEQLQLMSEALQFLMMMILSGLAKLIRECGSDWEELFQHKGQPLVEMIHKSNIGDLQSGLNELCTEVSDILELKQPHNGEQYIEGILLHIKEHFNHDLDLKRLSELFFLNPYYIGKLIKKKQGESFNEYMHKLRIEEAARLLQHSTLSIQSVSEKVGYKYLHHFYKYFKQITGSNPGEFKKDKWQP